MSLRSVRRRQALRGSALLLLICGLPTAACRSPHEHRNGSPILAVVDPVELIEPDTVQIGRFAYVAFSQTGSIFVADLAGGRILRFSPAGILDAVIGSLGRPPGELLSAGQIDLLQNDSVLAVPDPRSRAISLIDARDGRFLGRYRTRLPTWVNRGLGGATRSSSALNSARASSAALPVAEIAAPAAPRAPRSCPLASPPPWPGRSTRTCCRRRCLPQAGSGSPGW